MGRDTRADERTMLPSQRRHAILAQVREQSAMSAEALSRMFGVSVETIRRDLRGLQERGLLDRVYGGATRPDSRSSEGSFATRSAQNLAAKQAIAALAATLVGARETIVIDSGTTALLLARALPASFRGRALTNSMLAATELAGRSDVEVLLCGGQIRPGDGACFGPHAEAFFADFYADRAFLGAGGVHPEAGLTDYYPAEAVVRRRIVANSARTYVLADSSKLGVVAVHRICPLTALTALITNTPDAPAPAPAPAADAAAPAADAAPPDPITLFDTTDLTILRA